MTKFKELMILVEVTENRSRLVDILAYAATTQLSHDEYFMVHRTIVEKMQEI